MMCAAAPVAAIRVPVGPAHYQEGLVTLLDGTTFSVQGDPAGTSFIRSLRRGDRIQICFGPSRRWADEPPTAREGWALRVRDGEAVTTIGQPGKSARQVF
jgi:hypothetical protein